MIWYILLAIAVYLTLTIVIPVVLHKMGVLSDRCLKEGLSVWVGILWPIFLIGFGAFSFFKSIKILIEKLANVK